MTRKFWESLSSHLCPSSELLCSISTWSSNMCPKHNTSKYKFLITPKHAFHFLISINISNFLPVTSTKNLKGSWKCYPKIFFVLLFSYWLWSQNKARSNILTTSTYCYHYDPWHHQHHLFLCILEMYSEYSFILSPIISSSSLNVIYFFKMCKTYQFFPKNLQDSYHWGKFKDVNRSYRSLQKCFHFSLMSLMSPIR